jgi:hypothetical protein
MHDNESSTWLARDGDSRILEVDTESYPRAEASPGDGRPVAEAADPGQPTRAVGLLMAPPRAGKAAGVARQLEAEAG